MTDAPNIPNETPDGRGGTVPTSWVLYLQERDARVLALETALAATDAAAVLLEARVTALENP